MNNLVLGNLIGTDASGSNSLPNGFYGVSIALATNNTIGGNAAVAKNVISGNVTGIYLTDGSDGNQVLGNFIGTDASGQMSMADSYFGVELIGAARNNSIGGTAAGAGNLISGNGFAGIELTGSTAINQILGNRIGTNVSGTNALANGSDRGVPGDRGRKHDRRDGDGRRGTSSRETQGAGSISSSARAATWSRATTSAPTPPASAPWATAIGISINAASSNTIGGAAPGRANVISGNTSIGIQISNSAAKGNSVLGNLIGTNRRGTTWSSLPTWRPDSPSVCSSAIRPENFIGGTMLGAGNVISGFGVAVDHLRLQCVGQCDPRELDRDRSGRKRSWTARSGSESTSTARAGASWAGRRAGPATSSRATRPTASSIFGSLATGNVVQGNQIGLTTRIQDRAARGGRHRKCLLEHGGRQHHQRATSRPPSTSSGNG